MANENKKKQTGYLILFISITIIIIIYIFKERERSRVDQEGRYTIFYIEEVQYGKGSPEIRYYYFDNGKKIKGEDVCSSKQSRIIEGEDSRFFGKYITGKDMSYLCCYCEVPDSITKAPLNGWEIIPVFCSPC